MRKTKGPGAGIETVAEYAKRWLDNREGRVHSLAADRSRMRFHVLPTLGPLDVAKFTRDDVERLRDALDQEDRDTQPIVEDGWERLDAGNEHVWRHG